MTKILLNGRHYDFKNNGFKLHIPVVADIKDKLTLEITQFLDEQFGTSSNYQANGQGRVSANGTGNLYKVGAGGCSIDGSGITVFGKTSSRDELEKIAKELEVRFGDRIAECMKKNNITFRESDVLMTPHITSRFSGYHVYDWAPGWDGCRFRYADYDIGHNPSNAPTARVFRTSKGNLQLVAGMSLDSLLSSTDLKFLHGASTLQCIDDFGEMFTGKIVNGKIPQHILDGLPQEFLEQNPNLLSTLEQRINKGTSKFVAGMFNDIVKRGNNSLILGSSEPWLTTLAPERLNEALKYLKEADESVYNQFKQMLPDIQRKIPSFSVLYETKMLGHLKPQIKPVVKNPTSWVDDVVAKWKANTKTPNPTTSVASLPTPSAYQQVPGLNKPTGYTQIAHIDIDKVFSTLTRGEPQARVVKPTTPVLQDVIEGALQRVHKSTVVRPPVATTSNMAQVLRTVVTHIKI